MRMQSVNLGSREWGVGSGCKSGFGLIEVLAASVVLGFLLVGLGILQKGNREGVLRIRARDAANFVAQHVLDSLGGAGLNSIIPGGTDLIYEDSVKYSFIGKNVGQVTVPYYVEVRLLPGGTIGSAHDTTRLTAASGNFDYSRSLEATVSWHHKNSRQSIRMAKVVR
jgi:prepilin-type N-terminal cleavage/methylation domain-containing protein